MKLGISADLHLTTKDNHPERYNALINILDQCLALEVEQLLLAGDVFDHAFQNYSAFETICGEKRFAPLQIHIIPGNHDPEIDSTKIVSKNVKVYSKPSWIELQNGFQALLIPYIAGVSMGEIIQEKIRGSSADSWVLVGHGDWSPGLQQPNPYEPGVYMPLTPKDITAYQPRYVFLGHLHTPLKLGNVYYPGSPCGLDITETSYRRFLILDTESNQILSKRVDTDHLYFNETLIVLPMDNEVEFVLDEIRSCIEGWGLDERDKEKVRLRVRFRGYSSDRNMLLKMIHKGFSDYKFYEEPDISDVSVANDPERNYLMERFLEQVASLEWSSGPDEPDTDEIILQAMRLVYGEE